MSDTIIAIDLSRYKSVACVYARTSREHVFTTIDTAPAALARFLERHFGRLVVIEACANASWVHDHAITAGGRDLRRLPRTPSRYKRDVPFGG